jgi:adenylosuccinate lyase
VTTGLVVYDKVIEKHILSELPFMATENIMMDCVKKGGDRQKLHEKIRELSMEAGSHVKREGLDNDLLELIASDGSFGVTLEELKQSLDPSKYTGCASHQTERFINECVKPVLEKNKDLLGLRSEINV